MGAAVSLMTAPMSMAAQCCGSLLGSCAATALCKACGCSCTASPRIASVLYFSTLMLFVGAAMFFRFEGGDIVLFGSDNATEASIIDKFAHHGTQGAFDYWNTRMYCAGAHPTGLIVCCANTCSGVFAVYRFSFVLCLFFAFLTLLTAGTTRYGARVHRGFWFLKLAVLIGLLASAVFVDNSAMAAYREVARVVSFFFLVLQILLLIDFGYRTNEWLVELDEASDYEGFCSWKIVLLVAAVVMYALSITMWVLEAQWFGGDGCGAQQALIAVTIVLTLALSIVSCTKIAPHGTLLTSAVVTGYATYQCYSALASHPNDSCNGSSAHTPDLLVGFVVFVVAMVSMAASAWSATSSKAQVLGKSSTGNADLTVSLEAGAGSSDAPADEDDETVGAESWWYYHLMMVVVSLYMAMLLSDWSVQPVDELLPPGEVNRFNKNIQTFWIKVGAQWVCLAMYAWTLLAPYLLRNVRDFGIEFDFD